MAYEMVILDSAFFKKTFSANAKAFIKSNDIRLSKTFLDEVLALSAALDSESKKIQNTNFNTFINMIQKDSSVQVAWGDAFDVCHRAVEMSRKGIKICVMTEDMLMIDRLLSCGTPVDVYDLNRDQLLQYSCHVRSGTVHVDVAPADPELISDIGPGTILRKDYKNTVELGDPVSVPGLEGRVYSIKGNSKSLAKLYLAYPSKEKVSHLVRLIHIGRTTDLPWCSFPEELLYRGDRVVGFVMPKLEFESLENDKLYAGDDDIMYEGDENDFEGGPGRKRSYTLGFCLMLLAQLKILSCCGLCVSDYNFRNFSAYTPGKPVTMVDIDSFGESNYFGNTVVDKGFSRDYQQNTTEGFCELCDEGALKMVFKLLSLGLDAYSGENQPYALNGPECFFWYRRYYFPENVLSCLDDVFLRKKLPSVGIATRMVSLALDELYAAPGKDITVKAMCDQAINGGQKLPPFTVSPSSEGSREGASQADAQGDKNRRDERKQREKRDTAAPVKDPPVVKEPPTPPDPDPDYDDIDDAEVPAPRKHRGIKWLILLLLLAAGGVYCYLLASGIIRF